MLPSVGDSIVVVGALTRSSFLHSWWDLKAAKMNVKQSLIQAPMPYKFKEGHDTVSVSLFHGISTFVGYLMPNRSL